MDIMVLVETMVVLFAMIMLGYLLNKAGILRAESNSVISELIVKVTVPMLVISSVCNTGEADDKGQIIKIFFIGIIFYILLIIFSQAISKIFKLNNNGWNIYLLMLIFTNTAFVGYPVLKALYGDYAIFASSILHMPFNVLIYSYGVYKIKSNKSQKSEFKIKEVLNIGVISAVIALVIFLLGIKVPKIVQEILSMVGGITTPLSMILIGSSLALIPIKYVFSDIRVYILSIIKLIIMPIIAYFTASFFTNDSFIVTQLTIATALPAGSMVVMLTTQYKGEVKAASTGVFITTFLSVLTIPLMVYVLLT